MIPALLGTALVGGCGKGTSTEGGSVDSGADVSRTTDGQVAPPLPRLDAGRDARVVQPDAPPRDAREAGADAEAQFRTLGPRMAPMPGPMMVAMDGRCRGAGARYNRRRPR